MLVAKHFFRWWLWAVMKNWQLEGFCDFCGNVHFFITFTLLRIKTENYVAKRQLQLTSAHKQCLRCSGGKRREDKRFWFMWAIISGKQSQSGNSKATFIFERNRWTRNLRLEVGESFQRADFRRTSQLSETFCLLRISLCHLKPR